MANVMPVKVIVYVDRLINHILYDPLFVGEVGCPEGNSSLISRQVNIEWLQRSPNGLSEYDRKAMKDDISDYQTRSI